MKRPMPALVSLVFALAGCSSVPTQHGVAGRARAATLAQQAGSSQAGQAEAAAVSQAQAQPQPQDTVPQGAKRKAPPRRAVWQHIETVPSVSSPPSTYQTLPVPQPSPMPAPPQPSSFPAQCGPLGCAAPDGTRLQGSGILLDPRGRMCVQGPVTVQCY